MVAGAPDFRWSVAEVARHAQVARHEAGSVLRRFAAAGIVIAEIAGRSRLYRWAPAMAYLFDDHPLQASREQVLDPVCGMPVDPATPHRRERADGTPVLLCSLQCAMRFDAGNRGNAAGWATDGQVRTAKRNQGGSAA